MNKYFITLIAMKLVLFFTVFFSLGLQAKSLGQTVTLHVENRQIKTVLEELKKQTKYRFIYEHGLIDDSWRVTVNAGNVSLEEAMKQIISGLPLEYSMHDGVVLIKKATPLPTIQVVAIQEYLEGRVYDEAGNALAGVSIKVIGTTRQTATDDSGSFRIQGSIGDQLAFSYLGYQALQQVATGRQMRIEMHPAEGEDLEEVVVIGYGTARKRDVTGSVARADIEAFRESPNVSLAQSLQGTVPGLNVGAVTTAGSDPSISIRGQTSISGSNAPLIVLDGIIYRGSIIDINPNDIESIDVLKDASAAAIYGSQATNGVIIITSKSGTAGGKPRIEYDMSYSLQQVSNRDMLPEDGAGFIRRIGDRFLSESRTGDDLMTPNPEWDPTSRFFGSEILDGYQRGVENNWWDLLTNKHPMIQNHNIGVGNTGERASYFFSLGYTDQKNVVINDRFRRYNIRLNLDTRITDWMKVGIQSFLSVNNYSDIAPSIGNIIGLPPQVPYLDDDGGYILQPYRGIVNPFLQMNQQDLDRRNNLFGNMFADIDIPFIKGLNYRLNFSQNQIASQRYNFNPYAQNFTGEGSKTNSSQYLYTVDNILSYQRTFGIHAVNATLLYGLEKWQYEGTTARASVFANDILGYDKLDAGQSDQQFATSGAWEESSLYSMVRLGYTYNDRYIITGTVRRDGFSGFGVNNKFGVFPSVALAWRLSDEAFIKDRVSAIDDLKLRASYGINGNRTVGRYQTLAALGASVGDGYLFGDGGTAEQGQYVSRLPNPDLKWETTASFNVGADFSLLNNRLHGTLEYYTSNTYDLLYNIDIPRLNGFATIPMNIGRLRNNGQEFTVTGVPIRKQDFSWDVTFNFSRNRNKVVSILGIDANGDGREDDLIASKIFIGHPLGVAYDFNITGMWQLDDYHAGRIPEGFTYGTYQVEDINGDGSYTADQDRKILGYTDPSYRFSIQSILRYKNWGFNFLINSIQGGRDFYYGQPGTTLANPDNIYGSNLFKFDYWTPKNPDARYRQIGYYTVALGETFSPYVQRSFVRLQDVTVSYDLPDGLLERFRLGQLKVFANGKNLLTFSDWDGWDPETGTGLDAGAYPLLRSYTLGLRVSF